MVTTTTPEAVDAFAERLFLAGLGALELLNVEPGCRLGLYQHFAGGGGHTPEELAAAAREWLEQQTVAGVLTVDDPTEAPDARRYRLPVEHAVVLLDRDSESFMAAFAAFIPIAAGAHRRCPRGSRSSGRRRPRALRGPQRGHRCDRRQLRPRFLRRDAPRRSRPRRGPTYDVQTAGARRQRSHHR